QFCIIHSKKGSCVFVVINIVRDNPSFFVAYFLFTQEFILNHKKAEKAQKNSSRSEKDLELFFFTNF
ncbi:MAG: hypothetical protein SOH91_06845, partial [Lactobacillus delbrueckii]